MAENQEVIEAQANSHDRQFFLNKVSELPNLIEWADEKIRNDKEVIYDKLNNCERGIKWKR